MTPKKNIVREPAYFQPDGQAIPSVGLGFSAKESRFIYWYCNPNSEAFMNAGRAAARAGYKGNTVFQGYQALRKPRVAKKINETITPVKNQLHEMLYRVIDLCRIRMLFDIKDFYRTHKRIIELNGTEIEVNRFEIIPLEELSWAQRMCVDNITFNGPQSEPIYILPDRDKNMDLFFRCYKLLIPERNGKDLAYKQLAEILRVGNPTISKRSEVARKFITDKLCRN